MFYFFMGFFIGFLCFLLPSVFHKRKRKGLDYDMSFPKADKEILKASHREKPSDEESCRC